MESEPKKTNILESAFKYIIAVTGIIAALIVLDDYLESIRKSMIFSFIRACYYILFISQ